MAGNRRMSGKTISTQAQKYSRTGKRFFKHLWFDFYKACKKFYKACKKIYKACKNQLMLPKKVRFHILGTGLYISEIPLVLSEMIF
mgnify:CR=1 FL=1